MSVTVLITAYNTPPGHLREAVQSALDQSEPDLDVLVVDDGSEPPLDPKIAGGDDPRVTLHRIAHRGLPHALIEGLRLARGDYVAILDHDDRLTPYSVAVRLEALRRTGAAFAYGDLDLMTPEGRVYGTQRFPEFDTAQAFIRACLVHPIGPIKHGTVLMDRALALELGNYDPALPIEYDLDLIVRLAAARGQVHVPDVVAQYRVHPGNFSRSFRYRLRQIRYRWKVLDRQVPGRAQRLADKAATGVTLLAKALWQGLTHRRPRGLMDALAGTGPRPRQ